MNFLFFSYIFKNKNEKNETKFNKMIEVAAAVMASIIKKEIKKRREKDRKERL